MSYYHDQAYKTAKTVFKRDRRLWTPETRKHKIAALTALVYQELLTDCATRTFAQRLDAATERAAEWLDAN